MLDSQAQRSGNLTIDGVAINIFSMSEAVSSIISAARSGDGFSVYTLNLDHISQLRRHRDFRAAYRRARFVTADGFPLVILGRLAGTQLKRTTGADLVEPVCLSAGQNKIPVFLFGSSALALHRSARRLVERCKGLEVVGAISPSRNFEPYSPEADLAINEIRSSGSKLCFVAMGAPKQEIFAARCLDELPGVGFLCIGAALDFIAHTQDRAPLITQKFGLEWAWRILSNPRRLGPRYARCMAIVPSLVARSLPQIVTAWIRRAA